MDEKEKVLIEVMDERKDSFMLGDGIDFFDGKVSTVYKAMDIWAKQQSIEFCQDVLNNIEVNGMRLIDYKKIDAEQLYEIFSKAKELNPDDIPDSVG